MALFVLEDDFVHRRYDPNNPLDMINHIPPVKDKHNPEPDEQILVWDKDGAISLVTCSQYYHMLADDDSCPDYYQEDEYPVCGCDNCDGTCEICSNRYRIEKYELAAHDPAFLWDNETLYIEWGEGTKQAVVRLYPGLGLEDAFYQAGEDDILNDEELEGLIEYYFPGLLG